MSTFNPDYHGLGEFLRSPEMEAAMRARAEKGKLWAEATAAAEAYDPASKDGRHYKDSFRVSSGRRGGMRGNRAYGRLENTDAAALWLELGTRNNKRHRILGRALDVMARG